MVNRTRDIPTELGYKLSPSESQFVTYLLEEGIPSVAYKRLVDWELEHGMRLEPVMEHELQAASKRLLEKPAVQEEYWAQLNEIRSHKVADATEVMQYFTQVMRGEIKDQFGLDASLSDRTQAAKELAKRTVDIENRMAGKPDAVVAISLNWKRNGG